MEIICWVDASIDVFTCFYIPKTRVQWYKHHINIDLHNPTNFHMLYFISYFSPKYFIIFMQFHFYIHGNIFFTNASRFPSYSFYWFLAQFCFFFGIGCDVYSLQYFQTWFSMVSDAYLKITQVSVASGVASNCMKVVSTIFIALFKSIFLLNFDALFI